MSFLSSLASLFAADDVPEYRVETTYFRNFLTVLEHILLALSIFVLSLWMLGNYIELPYYYFNTFYILLWAGVAFEYLFKLYFSNKRFLFVKKEWFSLIILLFPVLRPLQIFGFSRFIILILTKQLYDRFSFLQESRVLELLVVSSIVVILSADLFLLFEQNIPGTRFVHFSDALWFSVVTVATIGYGDVVPITTQGRILATFLIIFGVSVFGIVSGTISSYLVTRKMKSRYSNYTSVLDYAQEALSKRDQIELHNKLDTILSRLEGLEKKESSKTP